ncbi:MAG: cytidylate kinase [Proteobacteria bacterium]|nr:MAG: cytidylate kinase [Pseudomonadota bacterium]
MVALYWEPIAGLQIAVDGPSGSGKGTVAKRVGEELGLPVLDTGLLYRFAGWQAAEADVDLVDESAVLQTLNDVLPKMQWRAEGIFFESNDCTSLLRGEDVGGLASQVAHFPKVRTLLLDVQRDIAVSGCVMDGRDIGTVVLPDAQAKFFLTASQRERARRRWAQLHVKDKELSIEQVADELMERDKRDAERDCAPLERAKGAIQVDSTIMRVDEVVDRVLAVLERRDLIHAI